jgi:hypothetical protein
VARKFLNLLRLPQELLHNRKGKMYECITAKQKHVELRRGSFWLDDET